MHNICTHFRCVIIYQFNPSFALCFSAYQTATKILAPIKFLMKWGIYFEFFFLTFIMGGNGIVMLLEESPGKPEVQRGNNKLLWITQVEPVCDRCLGWNLQLLPFLLTSSLGKEKVCWTSSACLLCDLGLCGVHNNWLLCSVCLRVVM